MRPTLAAGSDEWSIYSCVAVNGVVTRGVSPESHGKAEDGKKDEKLDQIYLELLHALLISRIKPVW